MRLPPEPVLVAAKRWLTLLPTSGGIPRAQALLTSHASYSDLTPTQYAAALAWIRDVGIISRASSGNAPEVDILRALFEYGGLPWMQDADVLVQSPSEVPTDVLSAGAVLGLGADEVYNQLCAVWGKVDTAARERVGAAGEAGLVELLRSCSGGTVEQVSNWSDGLGYDISFASGSVSAHLEVKSTTRRSRLTVYLSRNEYEVMLRDTSWVLVVVRLTDELLIDGTGTVPTAWIRANVPRDTVSSGSWSSCKLEVPRSVVGNGIAELAPALTLPLPSW